MSNQELYVGEPVVRTGPDYGKVVQGETYFVKSHHPATDSLQVEGDRRTYIASNFVPASELEDRELDDQISAPAGAIWSDIYETAESTDDELSPGDPVTVLEGGIVLGGHGSQRPEDFVGKRLVVHRTRTKWISDSDRNIAVCNYDKARWATALRSHVVPISRQEPDTNEVTLDLRATFATDPNENEPCLDGVANFITNEIKVRLVNAANKGSRIHGYKTTPDHLRLMADTLQITVENTHKETS